MKISDIADIINITEKDPSTCGIDVFVGLEHYDIAEPVIKRFGSTKMLTTATKKFEAGDVLIARRNVYLQRASLARFSGLTSGDSIILRVKKNLSSEITDYETMCQLLPFILNSSNFWDYANTNSDGTMSKRLSPAMLQDYEFELPSLAEQKVLAEKLWAAYEVKQSYLKMIEATEEMVKSQFIEMFGDPVLNSKKWKKLSINDLCIKITDGTHKTPVYQDDGVVFLSAKNIKSGKFDYKEIKHISTEEYLYLDKRCSPRKNDIVITKSGSIGDCAILDADFPVAFFESLALLKIKECISPLFFKFVFKNEYMQKEIMSRCIKGLAIKHLHLEELKKIEIIVPPISKQIEFDSIVQQADKSISELRKSIDAIDKVIKSLINENL